MPSFCGKAPGVRSSSGYFVSSGHVSLAHDWWPRLWNCGITRMPRFRQAATNRRAPARVITFSAIRSSGCERNSKA